MKVAEFYLVNEKGTEFSLMDFENYCWLTDPSGLGYSYSNAYEQLGNTFLNTLRTLEQGSISGVARIKNYSNFKKFVDYLENSEILRFVYKIPLGNGKKNTYYRKVLVKEVPKGYLLKDDEYLESTISFDCLGLWYEENKAVFTVSPEEDEICWDFQWDSKFSDYSSRGIGYVNQGHVEAPILVSIDGHVINPSIELYVDEELVQTLTIPIDLLEYEKLLYGTEEGDFYLNKQNEDGTLKSLFSLEYLDINNDNVIRLPKNKSCRLKITAEEGEILNAEVTILPQYKVV